MNDKIIINIISKTYFAIISFFIFIFLILSIFFITLQNGIFIKNIHISNIELEELYIKWNEKIDISLKKIIISQKPHKKKDNTNFTKINNYLQLFSKTTDWFNYVIIEKIVFQEGEASFEYKSGKSGLFLAKSNNIDINASISFDKNIMIVKLLRAYDTKRKISTQGNFYFNTKDRAIYTKLNMDIAKDINFDLYCKIGIDKLFYKLHNNKDITNISHIINILHLPRHIRYWAYDAIQMKSLQISDIHGFIAYDDVNSAYKNLTIKSRINQLKYKYNKKLQAITSGYTTLNFSNGVLYVQPYEAYTYGAFLDKSRVKIDFTTPEEELTLNLLLKASVDKNILKILSAYKIKLPFVQNSGFIQTDLKLKLWLQSLDVDVQGKFFTQKANLDYLGVNVNIADAHVLINNNDISIDTMKIHYKKIAQATLTAKYNAKQNKGKVKLLVQNVHAGKFELNAPTPVVYTISPQDDTIHLHSSVWRLNSHLITLNETDLAFDMKTLTIRIPPTGVTLEEMGDGVVSGSIDLNTMSALLDANIHHFSYDGIQLAQKSTTLQIKYNKFFSFTSNNTINFSIAGTQYKADKIHISIDGDDIYLKHTLLHIGKYISTKIYASYNLESKKSHISLNNFTLIDANTKKLLYKNKKILLSASNQGDTIKVDSKELDAEFFSKESGWKLYLHSINTIARNSDLLQKFKLNDGTFTIYKNKKDTFTKFKSKISYPYKILVKANKPISEYTLKGKVYKEKVEMLINDSVNVTIQKNIEINAENRAININEVLRALGDINSTKENNSSLAIFVNLKNSYLYINEKRKIIYDTIHLKYLQKKLTANLNYSDAHSHLRLKNKQFHLYGSNFNDVFMNKLFALTTFNNGRLNFSVTGDVNNYNGVLYVKKTLLKDYKLLNNILAFVNTVPSLVTFSLPGYNKNGLFIKKSYVKFNYAKEKIGISDIYVDSKEVDIFGKGTADIKNDTLDLVLNLKTDLGSDLSKIPLVGYILLNGDSISTTLSIQGKLSNPKVRSLIAKEIIVAPFNIIKRTLLLPYKIFKDSIE